MSSWFRGEKAGDIAECGVPTISEQIDYATGLTLRNLDIWRTLAAADGAKLTFVLQPLANWIPTREVPEEEALFAELERHGRFAETYGDILDSRNYRAYAERLRQGIEAMQVRFIDMASVIGASVDANQWLFVDRIHFTDHGNNVVAKALLDVLNEETKACGT